MPASQQRSPVAQAPRPSAPAAGMVDVCGYGEVPLKALAREQSATEPPPVWVQAQLDLQQRGWDRLLSELAVGDGRQRVAAAVLQNRLDDAVRIAAGSGDASIYGLAVAACRSDLASRGAVAWRRGQPASAVPQDWVEPALPPEPQLCGTLSLQRWAQLDPGDARPWSLQLADALKRKDEAAVQLALYELVQRQRLSTGVRGLTAVAAAMLGPQPDAEQSLALTQVFSAEMSSAELSVLALARACSTAAVRDANRRQLCGQAMDLLAGQATDLLDAAVVESLAKTLDRPLPPGWISKDAAAAGLAVATGAERPSIDGLSCAGLRRVGLALGRLARDGELTVARAALAASAAR